MPLKYKGIFYTTYFYYFITNNQYLQTIYFNIAQKKRKKNNKDTIVEHLHILKRAKYQNISSEYLLYLKYYDIEQYIYYI